MDCPRDGRELEYQGFWKYPRHACGQCRGVFVSERDMTESLGRKGPTEIEDVAQVKLDNVTDSDLQCPKDRAGMKAVILAGAEIDVCPSCTGLWLDKGEYEKIMERMKERIAALRPNPKPRAEPLSAPPSSPPPEEETVDPVIGFILMLVLPHTMVRWLRRLGKL